MSAMLMVPLSARTTALRFLQVQGVLSSHCWQDMQDCIEPVKPLARCVLEQREGHLIILHYVMAHNHCS